MDPSKVVAALGDTLVADKQENGTKILNEVMVILLLLLRCTKFSVLLLLC